MFSEGHRTFYRDDLLSPHVNRFYSLWNNVLTHYPQPSRHVPQGMHRGNSLIDWEKNRSTTSVLIAQPLCETATEMQHTNIVLMQNVLSTHWDMAELFSKTLAIKLSDKRLSEREFATGPICHLEQRYKLKSRCCCLPSHFYLPAWKNPPRGDNCADAICHFLKLYYRQTVTMLVYMLKL